MIPLVCIKQPLYPIDVRGIRAVSKGIKRIIHPNLRNRFSGLILSYCSLSSAIVSLVHLLTNLCKVTLGLSDQFSPDAIPPKSQQWSTFSSAGMSCIEYAI